MRFFAVVWAAILVSGLSSCDPPALLESGQACNSLSDCREGLSCVEGVCDPDVATLAGQVPSYGDAAVNVGAAPDAGGAATMR